MKINCFTCKYGYEDERLGIPMCHHPKRFSEDCVNFNMHEEKETEESQKPINLDDAMKELDEKIALVKERGTWDGVDVYKYMDEVRGREPEKMMVQEGLEKEMDKFFETMPVLEHENIFEDTFKNIAEHFAEWGYLRAAEKYNEIEYNRQRAWESVQKDLEEASEISFDEAKSLTEDYMDFLAKGLTEKQPRPIGPHWFCEYAKKRFIAGAEWAREQMLKDAVEGTVMDFSSNQPRPQVDVLLDAHKYHTGDKVRIIVCKKEEE